MEMRIAMTYYRSFSHQTIEEFAKEVASARFIRKTSILCRFEDVTFEVEPNPDAPLVPQDIINAYLDELDNIRKYYLTPKGELCKYFGFNRHTGHHDMQPVRMEGRYVVEILKTFPMTEEYFAQCSPLRLVNPVKEAKE